MKIQNINWYSPSYWEFIAVPGNVDPCPGLPCRARHTLLAKCRPKFISVATWGARFQGCSTPFTRFNLCENYYNPICASCRRAHGDWALNPLFRTSRRAHGDWEFIPLYRASHRAHGDWALNPLSRASRGAEALGYPGQNLPARAIPDKTSSVLIGRIRAEPCSIPASGAKPTCAERELQQWPSRPSAIAYRLR